MPFVVRCQIESLSMRSRVYSMSFPINKISMWLSKKQQKFPQLKPALDQESCSEVATCPRHLLLYLASPSAPPSYSMASGSLGARRQTRSTVLWLGGYLHSQGTFMCFSEIQNPSLGASQCMSQHRGDNCHSSGLSQAPALALPVWWPTPDRLCCWNSNSIPPYKPLPGAPLKTCSNNTSSFSRGPRGNTINSDIERSLVQSNGFSPSKFLDLRKILVHWVPNSPY